LYQKQTKEMILKQIIEALPNICSAYFEATLFASIFHYHYLAFLRIGEVVQSEISDHTLEVNAILYRLYVKHNQCNNEFIKNLSVWRKINGANFKEY
jgi:hypothetical protein